MGEHSEQQGPENSFFAADRLFIHAQEVSDGLGQRPMYIHHRSGDSRLWRNWAESDTRFAEYQEQLEGPNSNAIEPTPEMLAAVDDAIAFMLDATGLEHIKPITFIAGGHNTGTSYLNGYIEIFPDSLSDLSPSLQERMIAPIAVHEIAHSIPSKLYRVGVRSGSVEEIAAAYWNFYSGLSRNHFGTVETTHALEEAFAESFAVDYRQEKHLGGNEQDSFSITKHGVTIDMPAKYFYIEEGAIENRAQFNDSNLCFTSSALLVHSLDMLSDIAGEDLIALLRSIRLNPEESLAAGRKLAQKINNVEPGLYRKIRDCKIEEEAIFKLNAYVADIYADHFKQSA